MYAEIMKALPPEVVKHVAELRAVRYSYEYWPLGRLRWRLHATAEERQLLAEWEKLEASARRENAQESLTILEQLNAVLGKSGGPP